MKRVVAMLLSALALSLALPAAAEEPPAPRRGMRGMGPRHYDPRTVTTLAGEIAAVHRLEGRRGEGIHLELKAGGETLDVGVGPAWFLEKEKLQLAAGDKVEVTGSRVTLGGKATVIAQSVKKGDVAVALRDMAGVPVWAGRGSGRRGP